MKDIIEEDIEEIEGELKADSLGVSDSSLEKIAESTLLLESESQETAEAIDPDTDNERSFKQKKNKENDPVILRRRYIRAKLFKTIAFILPLVLCVVSFFDYHIYYSFAKTEGRLSLIDELGSYYIEYYDDAIFNYLNEPIISRYIQPSWHAVIWVIATLATIAICIVLLSALYKKEKYFAKVEPTSNEYKKYEQSLRVRRSFKTKAILIFSLIVVFCLAFFANYAVSGVEAVNYFNAGLAALPDADSIDYGEYYDIEEYGEHQMYDMYYAYEAYNSFSLWQRLLVKDTDKYLSLVPGYNLYCVDLVRGNEDPRSAAKEYSYCSDEQRALFTPTERENFEYIAEAIEIDDKIALIEISAYDFGWQYSEVKERFEKLPDEYKQYVLKADYLSEIPKILSQLEHLTFKKYEGGWEVRSEGVLTGDVVIPATYKGKIVKRIAKRGFSNRIITNVVLPITIESIGDEAFSHCGTLENIELPARLKTIGSEAFRQCSFTDVVIPSSVEKIGRGACNETDIVRLTLPDVDVCQPDEKENSHLANIFGYFTRADQVWVLTSKLREVIIKGGTEIDYTFWQCGYLQKLTIPKTVKRFGDLTFLGCTNLKDIYFEGTLEDWLDFDFSRSEANPLSNGARLYIDGEMVWRLVIPEGTSNIKAYAFYRCDSITSVVIPREVSSIEGCAFYNCQNLTDVYFEGSEEEWAEISIGSYNGSLTGATIHYNYTVE